MSKGYRSIASSAGLVLLLLPASRGVAQCRQDTSASQPCASEQQQVDLLRKQMEVLERQMQEAAKQLAALRSSLEAVQSAMAEQKTAIPVKRSAPSAEAQLAEQAAATSAQVATLHQEKVGTESRFPVRLNGTLLLNAFSNSGSVDNPAEPTVALGGGGSTGLSLRQTLLGFDAAGPHLLGAESHADLQVDFYGATAAGYTSDAGLLRLRTAHAALSWADVDAFFSLDHPLLSPYHPESLVAVSSPELAWSGNLWAWNPQVGVAYHGGGQNRLRAEAAVIDSADPYAASAASTPGSAVQPASLAEASRWPGTEARLAWEHGLGDRTASLGAGGYFSEHRLLTTNTGPHYDFAAWAGSLDLRLPLPRHLQLTATAYRGAALGGLGGGGYRDFVFRLNGSAMQVVALDDAGGWFGVHQAVGQRTSWNAGFGLDNPFAAELHAFPGLEAGNAYGNIARNRTVFGNGIYAPRAYLLFSAEYRNLRTASLTGKLWTSNVVGLGAAYRF